MTNTNEIHDAIANELAVAVGVECKKTHYQIAHGLAESLGLKFAEWTSPSLITNDFYVWYNDKHCSLVRLHDGLIDVGTGTEYITFDLSDPQLIERLKDMLK